MHRSVFIRSSYSELIGTIAVISEVQVCKMCIILYMAFLVKGIFALSGGFVSYGLWRAINRFYKKDAVCKLVHGKVRPRPLPRETLINVECGPPGSQMRYVLDVFGRSLVTITNVNT